MKAHSYHRSLICRVVLTLVLLNLIPLSLFSSVFNFSPLTLSSSFFACLWAPRGLFLVRFHPSFSTKHAARALARRWKRSRSPSAPGGHALDYTLRSESPQRLCTLAATRASYMHTCIEGIKSCTFCSRSLTPDRVSATHTHTQCTTHSSGQSLLMFSHTLQI